VTRDAYFSDALTEAIIKMAAVSFPINTVLVFA